MGRRDKACPEPLSESIVKKANERTSAHWESLDNWHVQEQTECPYLSVAIANRRPLIVATLDFVKDVEHLSDTRRVAGKLSNLINGKWWEWKHKRRETSLLTTAQVKCNICTIIHKNHWVDQVETVSPTPPPPHSLSLSLSLSKLKKKKLHCARSLLGGFLISY